jgi:hypothetical protein
LKTERHLLEELLELEEQAVPVAGLEEALEVLVEEVLLVVLEAQVLLEHQQLQLEAAAVVEVVSSITQSTEYVMLELEEAAELVAEAM